MDVPTPGTEHQALTVQHSTATLPLSYDSSPRQTQRKSKHQKSSKHRQSINTDLAAVTDQADSARMLGMRGYEQTFDERRGRSSLEWLIDLSQRFDKDRVKNEKRRKQLSQERQLSQEMSKITLPQLIGGSTAVDSKPSEKEFMPYVDNSNRNNLDAVTPSEMQQCTTIESEATAPKIHIDYQQLTSDRPSEALLLYSSQKSQQKQKQLQPNLSLKGLSMHPSLPALASNRKSCNNLTADLNTYGHHKVHEMQKQFVPYVQERDHLNNLLGSFIDMKRSGLRIDSDSYCTIDVMTDEAAKLQNMQQSKKFLNRKVYGTKGDYHRKDQRQKERVQSILRNANKKEKEQSQIPRGATPVRKKHIFDMNQRQDHRSAALRSSANMAASQSLASIINQPSSMSPKNWPTIWLRDNGQVEYREKTYDLLEDYLNRDLEHMTSDQIRQYYQRAALAKQTIYFADKSRRRSQQPIARLNTNSKYHSLNDHSPSGRTSQNLSQKWSYKREFPDTEDQAPLTYHQKLLKQRGIHVGSSSNYDSQGEFDFKKRPLQHLSKEFVKTILPVDKGLERELRSNLIIGACKASRKGLNSKHRKK